MIFLNYLKIKMVTSILEKEDCKFIKTNKKIEYLNLPLSFDIETTSFYEGDEKRAIMYAFCFGINGKIIRGRKWEEFVSILKEIRDFFDLNDNKRVIIYVHNLAFEFQFFKNLLAWEKVFAIDSRKPIYSQVWGMGIEFRCSYLLSGYSLSILAKNLTSHKIEKLIGDLDYSLIRHNETELTEQEWKYIENDVIIVNYYIEEEIKYYGDITRIPLTKTGAVRNYMRKEIYYDKTNKKNRDKFINYRKLMNRLTIDSIEDYEQLKRAFAGGFTHANSLAVGRICRNAKSFDFTSSYPYVLVSEKFPCNKAEKIELKSMEEFEENMKYYCCLFDITFYNLESTFPFEHPISKHKSFVKGNVTVDNGRVVKADELTLTCTEQDYIVYKNFYKWEAISIRNFKRFKKNYLPSSFVKCILDLYEKKTTLKGVEGQEVEYQKSKENVNSIYGMCVTDIVRDENVFDNQEWIVNHPDEEDIKEILEKYNKSLKRFHYYGWGVWCTAYARKNLFTAIHNLEEDYIYSDTDSVKFINYEKHEDYFKKYNERVVQKLTLAMNYHKFDIERVQPKTIKGEKKMLGLWDFDGDYKFFKTLGAKRYMYVDKNDKLSLTISGVNKKTAVPELLKKYGTNEKVLEAFEDGLLFDEDMCGKMLHTYIDEEMQGELTDYTGKKYNYYERSGVHLEKTTYELNLSLEFIDYLMGLNITYK